MLQRLESLEEYVRNLRKSIEDDRKTYGLVRPLRIGELLPNNNGIPLVKDLNNKENNAHGSNYNNNGNINIMDMNNVELELYGPDKSSCKRTTVARVYTPVRLKKFTEEDLQKWDLHRNNNLPSPWTYFKLNKAIYKPSDLNPSEHEDNLSFVTSASNDKKTMNNGNKNNNNQCTTTAQKTNPWKAREGNVSTMTEFFKLFF